MRSAYCVIAAAGVIFMGVAVPYAALFLYAAGLLLLLLACVLDAFGGPSGGRRPALPEFRSEARLAAGVYPDPSTMVVSTTLACGADQDTVSSRT